MIRKTKESGITLVALVVTIVVLIILATISINIVFGEEGILTRARQAKTHMSNAEIEEQTALNEMYVSAFGNELPENTKDTDAGIIVKTPSKWQTETPVYVSTEDGSIVKASTKIASVYAVATGNGETVPVPKDFYYVGGTIASGVVISDDEDDKNKYADDEDGDIPKDLEGNQFVWIPVSAENYKKVEWKLSNGNNAWNAAYDTSTTAAELPQIKKYGGFYIGRYEAGKGTVTSSSNVEIGSNIVNSSWTYSGWSVNSYTISGKISSKADEIPYYHANYDTAVQMSNNMYQTEYVTSGLITGTMWDAMMNFIGSTSVSSTNWGNYSDTAITLDSGKYRVIGSSGQETAKNPWTDGQGFKTVSGTRYILTTGSSESVKKNNLYDIAGNLWEWSQEAAFYNYTSQTRNFMRRGGGFNNGYSDHPVCYRSYNPATDTGTNCGFRPALYIM